MHEVETMTVMPSDPYPELDLERIQTANEDLEAIIEELRAINRTQKLFNFQQWAIGLLTVAIAARVFGWV